MGSGPLLEQTGQPMTAAINALDSGLAVFGDFAPDGQTAYDNAVGRFREKNIVLPTFAQLRDPSTIPSGIVDQLATVEKDAADARNLFRVHWYNEHADARATTTRGSSTCRHTSNSPAR